MAPWARAVLGAMTSAMLIACAPQATEDDDDGCIEATVAGERAWVFHGIPNPGGWGEDFVYRATPGLTEERSMGPAGGIPVVDVYTESGGTAIFNTAVHQEPMSVTLTAKGGSVEVRACGASSLERFDHTGDYYVALREFALRMADKGIATKPAPAWAFEPMWETYGFEERFTPDDILGLVPVLKELGVGSITIDSGWYGVGTGDDVDFMTGDFPVNGDTVGSEDDLRALIARLHQEGFRVRLWWIPGVAEEGTELEAAHPEWFLEPVENSTEEYGDIFLDPTNPEVVAYNRAIVERFLSWGADGFKQDDVYEIVSSDPKMHVAYAELFHDNWEIGSALHPELAINTCNCGIAQNFYQFPGENMLITSDPVGSRQLRLRAKAYHALNLGGAAILGDHVELTQGDVGYDDIRQPGFYDSVDFASIVPLGLVLESKFHADPGSLYRKWFGIYRDRRFFEMEWINVPYHGGVETYLMRDGDALYFTLFAEERQLEVTLHALVPGRSYDVYDLESDELLESFIASTEAQKLALAFSEQLAIYLVPAR